jgi:hypothetical protein
MNFSLNRHVLLAHWVPGFVATMALQTVLTGISSAPLKNLLGWYPTSLEATSILTLAVTALCVGEAFDAFRDWALEPLWDRLQQPVTWTFFTTAEKDKLESFRESHFTSYVFDCNLSLALVVLLATSGLSWASLALAVLLVVFVGKARSLRKEIAEVTKGKA